MNAAESKVKIMATKRTVAIGVRIGEGSLSSHENSVDEANATTEWHAPPAGNQDYVTLCGIDGDDPEMGQYGTVEPTAGQKITCAQCKDIWLGVIALKLRASDFE